MDVIAIQTTNPKTRTKNQPMWLGWWGLEKINPVELWRFYRRRFAVGPAFSWRYASIGIVSPNKDYIGYYLAFQPLNNVKDGVILCL